MAEGNNDSDEDKTEEPSEHKLQKAAEEGNVAFSREILQLVVIMGGALSILYVIPFTAKSFMNSLTPYWGSAHTFTVDNGFVPLMFRHLGKSIAYVLGFPLAIILLFVLAAGLGQKGKALSFKSLKPKLSNISLSKGIKKIFSAKAVIEFFKNLIKIIVLSIAIYFTFKSYAKFFDNWLWLSFADFFKLFHDINFKIFLTIIISFGAIAVFDFLYQRYTFMKQMRMTKQEIKEEYKQAEGDPHVKQRIRQLRHERAQRRMMQEVPTATAVLMNPTHYAVAIKWDEATMSAPKVVAKGQDLVALKIRDIANEHKVPVIQNPPLTRAIFSNVDLDHEIPPQYYKAIADVIRIVMKIKSQRF